VFVHHALELVAVDGDSDELLQVEVLALVGVEVLFHVFELEGDEFVLSHGAWSLQLFFERDELGVEVGFLEEDD